MRNIVLMLADGMRSDMLAGIPEFEQLKTRARMTLSARTVFPSITLPCHMSLFHSVDPARHGTTTNTYAPQVRPIRGLFEVLQAAGLRSAMYESWDQLRDVHRPGSISFHFAPIGRDVGHEEAATLINDAYFRYREIVKQEFTFLYYGCPDEFGHMYGWCGPEYMHALRHAWHCMNEVIERTPDTNFIILADHGGHDRTHGTMMPEDMTIPVLMIGPDFTPGDAGEVSIMDIAPTIAKLLEVKPDPDWEGKCLL